MNVLSAVSRGLKITRPSIPAEGGKSITDDTGFLTADQDGKFHARQYGATMLNGKHKIKMRMEGQ